MSRSAPNRTRPSRLGTIRKRPSGRYSASYRIEGRAFTAPRTFATLAEAEGWLATERADRLRGTWRDPHEGRISLGSYIDDWIASREGQLSPRTVGKYRAAIGKWIKPRLSHGGQSVELGALDLAALTPAIVRKWYAIMCPCAEAASLARLTYVPTGHPARIWAQENGLPVKDTGRIPPEILEQWRLAGSPAPAPRMRPSAANIDPGRGIMSYAYATLHAALNAAVDDGLLPANPCRIRGASSHTPRERGTCTPEEIASLAKAMPEHLQAAVIVAAWSALRYGELFALARRHVDLVEGKLRVERALTQGAKGTGRTKTRSSIRTVYLPRFVTDELARHMAKHTPQRADALIFTNRDGRPVTGKRLSAAFTRAKATIGRPELHWHDLRHTGATLAYREGATIKDVQRRLGHSTARAAMIYAHAADDSDALLAQRLNASYADTLAPVVPINRRAS